MYTAQSQQQILHWALVFAETVREQGIVLAPSVEVYLEPNEDGEFCRYYLADHVARVIFWLEPVSTEEVGLQPAISDEHLRHALEELYWNHVEYFPSHETIGLDLRLDELSGVLVQCLADRLTSETSTFPFTEQQCNSFIQVVRNCREIGTAAPARTRWSIARLWAIVCNHRFMTHYAQEHARLSRDQSILDISPVYPSRLFSLSSHVLFKIPEMYNVSFENLWADSVVYQNEWREFIPRCREEWILSTVLSFAVLICNLLILTSPHGTCLLSGLSVAFSVAAVAAGTILLTRHQRSSSWTAAMAADYLVDARKERSGFHLVSCLFSLPRGLLLWALATFSIQVPFMFSDMTGNFILASIGSALLIGLMIWLGRWLWRRCSSFLQGWTIFGLRSVTLEDSLLV
ncbi:unnamed protein product [Somion occarium]